MRFPQLRRVLRSIVIAGLPATAGCVEPVLDNGCYRLVDRTFVFGDPDPDPALRLAIESCRVDRDACAELCAKALRDGGVITGRQVECAVTFATPDVKVKVAWEESKSSTGCPAEGRRPAGLAPRGPVEAGTAIGAWLAHAAWLEAASIHAFVHLAHDLEAHGAPRSLARWALLAAREEVRHARALAAAAARYGAAVPVPVVTPPAPRALEAIAIENAAEGCVRETWGAAVAEWQARAARDPALRAAFTAIARDEARHAALAWAVDRWASAHLDPAGRARVIAARAAAARELQEEAAGEALDPAAAVLLGLPEPRAMAALAARADAALWSPAAPARSTARDHSGGLPCHA
jgi:hypothetical protein